MLNHLSNWYCVAQRTTDEPGLETEEQQPTPTATQSEAANPPQPEPSIPSMTLAQPKEPEQSSHTPAQQPSTQPSERTETSSPADIDYTLKVDPSKPIRQYQMELAEPGINGENYIVCAPTGTGKTLVAGLIISHHLQKRQNLAKKVVFIVPTRPLAEQQAKELQKLIPGAKVESSIGDEVGMTIKDVLPHDDIIVCTAGKLVNEIKGDLVVFSDIGLMVLDECHHTRKSAPYAKMMEKYLEEKQKNGISGLPQVVGLTASPGAGENPNLEMDKTIDHLILLCALMDARSGIKVVRKNVAELDQYTNKPTFTLNILNRRDPEEEFIRLVTDEMTRLENVVDLRSPFKKWSQEYETCVQQKKLPLEMSLNPGLRNSICVLDLLRCYSQALNVYMDLRKNDAISVLSGFTGLPADQQANSEERHLKQSLEKLIHKLTLLPSVPNPLLQKAEIILQDQFTKNPDSKGILFVRTKKHASSMCDWLSKIGLRIRPRMITGHTRDTGPGMTQVEQEEVMESFHRGECNVLVATSVAEEGLDVPACNLVIRFQHVSNEIAKTQTQGRARAAESEGFTILASDSKKPYQEMKNDELQALVDKVLQNNYFPTGQFLLEHLSQKQQQIIRERELKRSLKQQRQKTNAGEDIRLRCKRCKTFACSGSDVFSVENATHYVVPDKEFKAHKIVTKPHHSPMQMTKSMNKTHKIYCANCDADWGIMCIWPSEGYEFPVLKCKSFIFEIRGVSRSIRKWSDVPLEILSLSAYTDSESD